MNEIPRLTNTQALPRLNPTGTIFMASEIAPTPDSVRSPEVLSSSHETIALQARLLTGGEALNHTKKELTPVSKETLEKGTGSSHLIEQGSITERQVAYENEDFTENKRVWAEQVTQRFRENTTFWNSAKGTAWKETFVRIGINPATLDPDQLYDMYFSTGEKPSHERFVDTVLSNYTNDQGILNYDQLIKDKEALTWIAGMFGANSSEIIIELIQAKANLQVHPDAFVSGVNTAQNNTTRLNNLTSKEKHLLTFLQNPTDNLRPYIPSQPQRQPTLIRRPAQEPRQTQPGKQKSEYYWKYVHPDKDGVRTFTGAEDLPLIKDPETLAKLLQQKDPNRYEATPLPTLTDEIRQEQEALDTMLAQKGLDMIHIETMAKTAIDHYESFLQQKYNITTPIINHLTIFPIVGKTVEAFGKKDVSAFIYPYLPVIFLNIDDIAKQIQQLGKRNLQELSSQELVSSMERLLNEINPHEYTHLIGDIAFKEYKKRDDDSSTRRFVGAKAGISVTKPLHLAERDIDVSKYVNRGNLLSEGLTTELTNKWAESMNQELDINAYQQERKVLSALVKDLAKTQRISEEEAFAQFARGYFSTIDFRHLAKTLSAPHEIDLPDGKKVVRYGRPHLLSIVYGLMDYEHKKATAAGRESSYDVTLGFIQHRLSRTQNAEILRVVETLPVSKIVKAYLRTIATPQQQAA